MSNQIRKSRPFEVLERRCLLDGTAPFVQSLLPPDANQSVTIQFSEPVVGVDVNDFQLLRNGVTIDPAVLTLQNITDYEMQLMLPILDDGNYELHLLAADSGIQDLDGNALVSDADLSWLTDQQAPHWQADFSPTAPSLPVQRRIASLGDSMTLENGGSYVEFVRKNFSAQTLDAQVFAGSGWKVETIRSVWETEVRDAGFDSIIIFAGLTNLTSSTSNADEIFANLKSIYDDAMALGINVVCVSVCPWAQYRKWTAERQIETERLNTLISGYATAHPQYLRFVNAYDQFGMPGEVKRLWPRYDVGDGVHFAAPGDELLGQLVTDALLSLQQTDLIPQTAILQFSEVVTGLTSDHVRLTAHGQPISFQLDAINAEQYRIRFNLPNDSESEIALNLDLTSAPILDVSGNAVVEQPDGLQAYDYQAPTVSLTVDQPFISSQAVHQVTVRFSEAVSMPGVDDFVLLNDRIVVPMPELVIESIDAQTYRLHLLPFVNYDGNFRIAFAPSNQPITDSFGNQALRGTSIAWVTLPLAQYVVDNVLYLTGTRGIDTFDLVVSASQIEWAIHGSSLEFNRQGIDKVVLNPGAGRDLVSLRVLPGAAPVSLLTSSTDGLDLVNLYDSVESDLLTAGPSSASLRNSLFVSVATGFSQVTGISRSGTDVANLLDSVGNDQMEGRGWVTSLKGTGFANLAYGFATVNAVAGNGGQDTAELYDSSADDQFTASKVKATMIVPGYQYSAQNFARVNSRASLGNDRAWLSGTTAVDNYVGQASNSYLSGAGYAIYAYSFDSVAASGGGGDDRAILYDSPGNDTLTANTRFAKLALGSIELQAIDFPRTNVYARQGNDTANFTGRSISETFVGQSTYSSLTAGGFATYAYAFDTVDVQSSGGNDVATLFDSSGDDLFEASSTRASMTGAGFSVSVSDYRKVSGYARTGNDRAKLVTGPDSETLVGQSTFASFVGTTFSNYAYAFDKVEAVGDSLDTANLYDTGGNDMFEASATSARLYGAAYDNSTSGFGRVNAFARVGFDTATLMGTPALETFTGRSTGSSMVGDNFANYAYAFDRVTATSGGGADIATLYDTAGNDQFTASPSTATLSSAAYQITATNYTRFNAYASTGTDTATLTGSVGNELFTARPEYSSLKGTLFLLFASGFDAVSASGGGGNDIASFYDSAGNDQASIGYRYGRLVGSGYNNAADGFAKLNFVATAGNDTASLSGSAGDDTFTGQSSSATLQSSGFTATLASFDALTLQSTSSGHDTLLTTSLAYQLTIGAGWYVG